VSKNNFCKQFNTLSFSEFENKLFSNITVLVPKKCEKENRAKTMSPIHLSYVSIAVLPDDIPVDVLTLKRSTCGRPKQSALVPDSSLRVIMSQRNRHVTVAISSSGPNYRSYENTRSHEAFHWFSHTEFSL
jgi:hypothetical protein